MRASSSLSNVPSNERRVNGFMTKSGISPPQSQLAVGVSDPQCAGKLDHPAAMQMRPFRGRNRKIITQMGFYIGENMRIN
jgi:hypothetical protein